MLSLKTRSYSSTSSASSSSSSSRADDIFDSLSVMPQATVDIWSAGNVRVDGRDQSLPAIEAQELISALKGDERFQLLDFTEFGEDCKASYRIRQ